MPRNDLTEKQEAFARNFGEGLMSATRAAREAGYSDPNADGPGLLNNPLVARAAMDHMRRGAIRWQHLVEKVKRTLDDALDPKQDIKVRLDAVGRIVIALKKEGGMLLEEAAKEEDAKAVSNDALARLIVGPPPPTMPEQIN